MKTIQAKGDTPFRQNDILTTSHAFSLDSSYQEKKILRPEGEPFPKHDNPTTSQVLVLNNSWDSDAHPSEFCCYSLYASSYSVPLAPWSLVETSFTGMANEESSQTFTVQSFLLSTFNPLLAHPLSPVLIHSHDLLVYHW